MSQILLGTYLYQQNDVLLSIVWHANLTVYPGFLCAKPVYPIYGRLRGVNSISSKFSEKRVSGSMEGHGCHTLTCPLTPAETSLHVLGRRNCGLTRGQELCCHLPVTTAARIGAGQCRGPHGPGYTEVSHEPHASCSLQDPIWEGTQEGETRI